MARTASSKATAPPAQTPAATRRTAVKKAAVKKVPAKKAAAEKVVAKKAAPTRAAPGKAASKKVTARKSATSASAATKNSATVKTKAKPSATRSKAPSAVPARALATRLDDALHQLRMSSSQAYRDGLARYAIPSERAFGVPMGSIQALAKRLGRDHELAAALWDSAWYEARLLASYVDDPAWVTPAQMDRWARDFDNWAVCDTICFALFDRSPHAWRKIEQWAPRRDEYVRRAAFALLASKTVHDKQADDGLFLHGLELIQTHADDERNFVKKAVNWALRSIGKRNTALHAASIEVATRLASRKEPAPRWIGKDALRELNSASVIARLAKRRR
ncbi:DNA alkylation repair enzyme family protein [Lysobacter capsici]|nr:DNA alkylation repair enzyme family protein [Lysobacter capsici]